MARLALSEAARADLSAIYQHGVELFGGAQADRYMDSLLDALDLIAEFPEMARLRASIIPPVRVHRHQSHVVIYDLDDGGGVVIVRIRHVLEDWQELSMRIEE